MTLQVALQDCTCLVYSEDHAQLLTGTPATRMQRCLAVRDCAALAGTSDGRVHITYTWKRQRIRHAIIDPAKL